VEDMGKYIAAGHRPTLKNFHTHFQFYSQLNPPNVVFEVCKVDEYNWL